MKKIRLLKVILGLTIIPSQTLAYEINAIAPISNIETFCSIDMSDWKTVENFQIAYDNLQERLKELDPNSKEYKELNEAAASTKETLDALSKNMESRTAGAALVLTTNIILSRTYNLPNSLFVGERNGIKIRRMIVAPSIPDENNNSVKVTATAVQIELSSFAFCPYLDEFKNLQRATREYLNTIFQ